MTDAEFAKPTLITRTLSRHALRCLEAPLTEELDNGRNTKDEYSASITE